jgi:hypothetical protein
MDGSRTYRIHVIFRLYGPLQPFYDRTWRPGDPELVN